MTTLYKNLLAFVMLLSLAGATSSCADKQFRDEIDSTEGNDQIRISLFASPIEERNVLRAYDDFDEVIHNCILLVFDGDGNRVKRFVYDPKKGESPFTPENKWENSFNINRRAGVLTFVAIANFPENNNERMKEQNKSIFTAEAPDRAFLMSVNKKQDLENRLMKTTPNTIVNYQGQQLFVGKTLVNAGQHNGTTPIEVELKRVVAKITFDISLHGTDFSTRDFQPIEWRVINVPTKTKLLAPKTDDKDVAIREYTNTPWQEFTEKKILQPSSGSTPAKEYPLPNVFHIFLPPNRLTPQQEVTWDNYKKLVRPKETHEAIDEHTFNSNDGIKFGMRAHRSKTKTSDSYLPEWNVDNGEFDIAPQKATAIQVKGIYKEKSKERQREAHVTYTIPLGFVDRNFNDYNVEGNKHYIYHAEVENTENIRLEVEDNNLNKNHNVTDGAAKGHVVDSDKDFKELDAHYGSFIIRIKKSDILKYSDGVNFDYNTFTPFDKGGKADITWIRFMPITDKDSKGAYRYQLPIDLEKECYKIHVGNQYTTWKESNQTPKAFFADGLCNYLNYHIRDKIKKGEQGDLWDSNGEILIAGLVNEYYYQNVPTSPNGIQLYNGNLPRDHRFEEQGWPLFVNKPNRFMNIYYHDKPGLISADRESSYRAADFVVSQRSIKTLNKDLQDNKPEPAIGFETIDELYWNEGEKPHIDLTHMINEAYQGDGYNKNPYAINGDYQSHQSYGYRPTLKLYHLANDNGDDVQLSPWLFYRLSVGDHFRPKHREVGNPWDKKDYSSSIIFNCLARNSDLNGDGYITPDEIRWYIPSYRQMMQLILADDALPLSERLLNSHDAKNFPNFMVTTTSTDFYHFYAVDVTKAYTFHRPAEVGKLQASIRCIRNLGKSPNKSISEYERIIKDPIYLTGIHLVKSRNMFRDINSTAKDYDAFYASNESTYPFLTNNKKPNDWLRGVGIVIHLDKVNPSFLRHHYISYGELRSEGSTVNPKDGEKVQLHSTLNLPYYQGFRVAASTISTTPTYNNQFYFNQQDWLSHRASYNGIQVNCYEYTELNPDGTVEKGWRIPNSTELAIMNSYIPWKHDNDRRGWGQWGWKAWAVQRYWLAPHMSATYYNNDRTFGLWDTGHDGVYVVDTHQKLMETHSGYKDHNTYYVMRCVKDWEPQNEEFGHPDQPLDYKNIIL